MRVFYHPFQTLRKYWSPEGRSPRGLYCFEMFGTVDKTWSTKFWYDFSNETIRNYALLHRWWIVAVQLASDHEWRKSVVCKVWRDKNVIWRRKFSGESCPLVNKVKTKQRSVSIFSEWQLSRTTKVPVLDSGRYFKSNDLHKVQRFIQALKKWTR